MPGRTGAEPTLIYDGACSLCCAAVARVSAWDREHRVRLVPFQDRAAVAKFRIERPALAAAMHFVREDGRVFEGADAIPELLRLLPGKRWFAWWFAVPGVRPLARRVYGYVARRRGCRLPLASGGGGEYVPGRLEDFGS